jgi:hypothetical protein
LQAIRADWDTPRDVLEKNLELVSSILNDPASSHRERLTCVQIVMALESRNIQLDQFDEVLSQAKAFGAVYQQAVSFSAQNGPSPKHFKTSDGVA